MAAKKPPATGEENKGKALAESAAAQERLRGLYDGMLRRLEEMNGDFHLLENAGQKAEEDGPRYDVVRAGVYVRTLLDAEKLRRELYDLPPAREAWAARKKAQGESGEDNRVFFPPVLDEEPPDCPETNL